MTAKIASKFGACLVAAACTASTHASAQVGGTVDHKCGISAATTASSTAAIVSTNTGTTMNFSGGASNSFGDGSGHGLAVSGSVELTLDTTVNCTVTLSSLNGVLWNSQAGAVRNYTANAFDKSAPAAKAELNLNNHAAPASGTFQTMPTSAAVRIEFTVPGTESQVLPAGTYTDTLTLTMSTS